MSTLLTALLLYALATTGPVAVDVRFSPAEAAVGDPVTFEITVRAFGANTIRIATLPGSVDDDYVEDEKLAASDLLIRLTAEEEKQDLLGAFVARRTYSVVPFTVGDKLFPPVAVKVVMNDGTEINLNTPAVSLGVRSIAQGAEGPQQIADLRGLLLREAVEQQSWLWFWVILGAIALVVGCAAVIALNKRTPRRLRKLMELTPAQRALKELDQLVASRLLEDGKIKEFYTALSEIVRRYLGMRFSLPALEMTTAELTAAIAEPLEQGGFSIPEMPILMRTSDLVKFAKLEPPVDRGIDLLEAAREIVMFTRDDLSGAAPGRAA